jgi:hypothetical protein
VSKRRLSGTGSPSLVVRGGIEVAARKWPQVFNVAQVFNLCIMWPQVFNVA